MQKVERRFDPVNDDTNWKILLETHLRHLRSLDAISSIWSSGFKRLGIDLSKRPTAEELTQAIEPYTAYTFIQTEQSIILPQDEWYGMIARFEMPFTCFLRTPEELNYCDEPDVFHDILGHVPFLAEQSYSDMYQLLAHTYLEAFEKERNDLLKELDFIGGMIIELGLIREEGKIKAFGSTFYSSSEVFEAYKPENQIPFTAEALSSGESYDRHSFQGKYYIFDSLQQLIRIIKSIASRM